MHVGFAPIIIVYGPEGEIATIFHSSLVVILSQHNTPPNLKAPIISE